jgi:hypothetical protein
MSQNRSSAVMQQRSEPDDSLDDFPTPPWGGRALCEALQRRDMIDPSITTCWEPAANRGYLRRGLNDYFRYVAASDVHDYGAGFAIEDFLFPSIDPTTRVDWIITNPPFRLAQQFLERALYLSPQCALLVRSAFLEGRSRYETLFTRDRPSLILQFAERLPMNKGVCRANMTTATAYCWVVWAGVTTHTEFDWIPPCRKRLEKAGDYD